MKNGLMEKNASILPFDEKNRILKFSALSLTDCIGKASFFASPVEYT